MSIEYIDVKLKVEEARKLFKSRMGRFNRRQFRFETGFFIPYYLFQVEILNGDKLTSQLLAIDAMTGELDLYRFEKLPTEFAEIETTQFGKTILSEKQAIALLNEKVRRMVYLQGFFKIRDLNIMGTLVRLIYLPYRVGFYTRNHQVVLEVVDAVRGCFEGAKVRDLVMDWFAREAEHGCKAI